MNIRRIITAAVLFACCGSVVEAQMIETSRPRINFGWVRIGDSIAVDITVTSTGEAENVWGEITISDRSAFRAWMPEPLAAMRTLKDIVSAISVYRSRFGVDPNSVGELTRQGFLVINNEVSRRWTFNLIGNPIMQIEAISTRTMTYGEGHIIIYDIIARTFFGFGSDEYVIIQLPGAGSVNDFRLVFNPTAERQYNETMYVVAFDEGIEHVDSLAIPLLGNGVLGVELLDPAHPTEFGLEAPHPNPFNSLATVEFAVGAPGQVRLAFYDMGGRLMLTMLDGHRAVGRYEGILDAGSLPAGTYMLRLESGNQSAARVVSVLK